MDINPIIPANFEEKLKTYLREINQKKANIVNVIILLLRS